jgi:hypothetical protein
MPLDWAVDNIHLSYICTLGCDPIVGVVNVNTRENLTFCEATNLVWSPQDATFALATYKSVGCEDRRVKPAISVFDAGGVSVNTLHVSDIASDVITWDSEANQIYYVCSDQMSICRLNPHTDIHEQIVDLSSYISGADTIRWIDAANNQILLMVSTFPYSWHDTYLFDSETQNIVNLTEQYGDMIWPRWFYRPHLGS